MLLEDRANHEILHPAAARLIVYGVLKIFISLGIVLDVYLARRENLARNSYARWEHLIVKINETSQMLDS